MPDRTPREETWRLFPTPEILDDYLVEFIDRDKTGYIRLPPGTPHPDRANYPGFLLADDRPAQGSDHMIHRFWTVGSYSNQDIYNYGIKYAEASTSHPLWVRRYLVRRDVYEPLATGGALTGVFLVKVTNAGSGYTTPPTVALTGGAGSGATAVALLTSDGTVGWVRITAEGTGYTSAPSVGFSGGGGSGAAATAYIQATSAKLVAQEVEELPADDARHSLFVRVTRVYKTLPGPAITTTALDDDGQTITTTRQEMAVGDVVTSEAITGGAWVRKTKGEGDSVTAQQMTVSRPLPGDVIPDAAAPDYDSKVKSRTRQLKELSTITASEVSSGGFLIVTSKRAITDLVGWEIIETRDLPGNPIVDIKPVLGGRFERHTSTGVDATGALPATGNGVMASSVRGQTAEWAKIVTVTLTSDGTTAIVTDVGYVLYGTEAQLNNADNAIVRRLRDAGATLPAVGAAGSSIATPALDNYYVMSRHEEPVGEDSARVWQVIELCKLPDPKVDYVEISETFPGSLVMSPFTWAEELAGMRFPPPWADDGRRLYTYRYDKPRNRRMVGRVVTYYRAAPNPEEIIISFQVFNSAGVSRLPFPLTEDTVHGAITLYESNPDIGGGVLIKVVDLPASRPSVYRGQDILRHDLGSRKSAGPFYAHRVLEVSELTPLDQFPAVTVTRTFTADSPNPITNQPEPSGSRLYVSTNSGSDTGKVVTFYGNRDRDDGPGYKEEQVTIGASGAFVGTNATKLWFQLAAVSLSAASAGTVTVSAGGQPSVGYMNLSGVPATGGTFTIGSVAYTLQSPARATILCPAGSALVTTAAPASYVTATFAGAQHYFWFSNGTTTDPAPGGTGHAIPFTGGDADTVIATSLANTVTVGLAAVFTNLIVSVSSATITLTGLVLAAITLGQDAGADFTLTTVEAGAADAANQIRTGYDTAGVAMTAAGVAQTIVYAVNGTTTNSLGETVATAGRDYGTGTVVNPDILATLTSSFGGASSTAIALTTRQATGATFTLSESATNLTVTAVTIGEAGLTIATFTGSQVLAYPDINFNNPTLFHEAGGADEANDDLVDVANVAGRNFPPGTVTVQAVTQSLPSIASLDLFVVMSQIPPIALTYEYQTGAGWQAPISLPKVGARKLMKRTIAHAGMIGIRLNFSGTGDHARRVHSHLTYAV